MHDRPHPAGTTHRGCASHCCSCCRAHTECGCRQAAGSPARKSQKSPAHLVWLFVICAGYLALHWLVNLF
ncbi:hypothetical protein [Kitasatospora sp. NPDC088783]|uniref:hypothetical protein n=1 Tax=Kitasatospora sp. NPDC088783 TaxID=3364077 RepID=UPI0038083907